MAGAYRPEQREIFAQCWTEGTWLSGGICLPAKRALADHLNQKDAFLKLRNVALSHKKAPLAFLALRLDRVPLIVPSELDGLDPARMSGTGLTVSHRVLCLLRGAILSGTLETLENLRVSDFLQRSPRYFTLRDCTLRVPNRSKLPFQNPIELVLVNADCVTGVAEEND